MLFEKMTFEDYEAVIRSKVSGAQNFHESYLKDEIDFFIMLSSVAGIVGNRGQAAYAAANTYLDALARHRQLNGSAATTLNLTAVDDVGYLAGDASKKSEVLKNLSGSTMSENEVLSLVDATIGGQVQSSCGAQCITGLHFDDPSSLPFYASDGKFNHLREAALANSTGPNSGSVLTEQPIAEKLKRVTSHQEAIQLVTAALSQKLGAILMIAPEDMEAQQSAVTITAFGLDSLNAIELRNWIGKELQTHLQVLELLTSGRLPDLASLVLRKTRLSGQWTQAE